MLRRVVVPAALVAAALAAAPAGAATVPLPDQDPFYAVPANIAGLPNGNILKSRPITATTLSIPLPVRAWQVQYKTLDAHDQPTADVATVMVPRLPWLGHGARPLVSYETAEDGVGSKCSASYALRAGVAAISSNSELETGLMATALLRGFAVVAPDYEGPNSAFLGAAGEAHGVLDGVRAARAFAPAGLGSAAIGLWGYSGGALASDLAAQLQPTYAPELKLAGVALGGVVGDLDATLHAFNASAFGGAIVVGLVGLDRAYPEQHLTQYPNAAGKAAMANSQTDCITDAAVKYPFLDVASYEATPGAIDLPQVKSFLHSVSPLGIAPNPIGPIYDYHSVFDELAPIGPDRTLMARYCAAGVKVQHVEDYASEHLILTATGALGAIAYLGDRFAGKPAPSNC